MSTKFAWARPHPLSSESTATVTWRVPAEAAPGTYRLRTFGDSKGMFGSTTPFSGTSGELKNFINRFIFYQNIKIGKNGRTTCNRTCFFFSNFRNLVLATPSLKKNSP